MRRKCQCKGKKSSLLMMNKKSKIVQRHLREVIPSMTVQNLKMVIFH